MHKRDKSLFRAMKAFCIAKTNIRNMTNPSGVVFMLSQSVENTQINFHNSVNLCVFPKGFLYSIDFKGLVFLLEQGLIEFSHTSTFWVNKKQTVAVMFKLKGGNTNA